MLVTTKQVFASANESMESVGVSGGAYSQQAGKKITGKVNDATGELMPGVYVIIQGTNQGGQNA